MKGEIVIPLIYDDISSFSEGLAAVGIKDDYGRTKYGFINGRGTLVVKPEYTSVGNFSEGFASVSDSTYGDEQSGFINKKGVKIIPFSYKAVGDFKGGNAPITKLEYEGPIGYDRLGKIDRTGKEIIPTILDQIIEEFDDGEIFIGVERNNTYFKIYGLYDKFGKKLTSNYYSDISSFVEGFAMVRSHTDFRYTDKSLYGFINKKGVEIVACKYEDITHFRNGICAVFLNGKWGLLNQLGENITPIKYDEINLVNDEGHVFSIINYRNEIKLSPFFSLNKFLFYINGYCIVCSEKKFGVVDNQGHEVVPCKYDLLTLIDSKNKLFSFKKNNKFGVISIGKGEIVSPIFNEIRPFSDGLAACKDGSGNSWSSWGFITTSGSVIIPYKYFEVGDFHHGLAAFKKDGLWGYINKFDEVVIKPMFSVAGDFKEGAEHGCIALVHKWDGKSPEHDRFLINGKGKRLGITVI